MLPEDPILSAEPGAGAAFGRYPRQRATPTNPEAADVMSRALPEAFAEYALPHDAVDAGMMLMGGPLGRVGRQLGAALIAGGASSEAEAAPPLKKAADWLSRTFYRGIPRLEGKDIEAVSGLHMPERGKPIAASPHLRANTGNYAWASDNPLVGESYTHMGGVMVPLRLAEPPGAVLDAGGRHWREFFFGPENWKHDKPRLNPEYKDLLRDPDVRSILVQNIVDAGMNAESRAMQNSRALSMYGKPWAALTPARKDAIIYGDRDLLGNNLLIKDPRAVKFELTGEPGRFAHGGRVNRQAGGEVFPDQAGPGADLPPNRVAPGRKRGGLAQVKECVCNA